MAITKTNFINYSRCPRYAALDGIKIDKKTSSMTYEEYIKEESNDKLKEIIGCMYEIDETTGEEIDTIDVENPQLATMMKYYKKVEELAAIYVKHNFDGITISSDLTYDQQCFEYIKDDIKYLCYVDVYNENKTNINIIEVKATTSKKYLGLECGYRGGDKYSIFHKINNIYYLKDEIDYPLEAEMKIEDYNKKKMNLFDRYKDTGKYVYDLAVQRFIIEGYYNSIGKTDLNIKYYLAVLNHEYIFNGEYVNGEPNYKKDSNGNEIVTLFDLTKVTAEYQDQIRIDSNKIERYIFEDNCDKTNLGQWCEYKKQTQCKYFKKICGKDIPYKNSSLNYMNNGFGFKDEEGNRHKGLDLINEGYINMLDVPEEWIVNTNHFIQRDALKNNREYIDKEKIKISIDQLSYPIYHLDFETFPCPLPRYKGEWCYIQSPFEFSLHIERSPGVCDKDKDNYVFLAANHEDIREGMIKDMIRLMDFSNGGTLFAQNVTFEKGRIKELANFFPQYKDKLMTMYNNAYDLLYIVNNRKDLYLSLGYSEEDAKKVNYYHKDLSGSYSIKKTLPVFSDLTYANLEVKNGTEALIEYANYPYMTKEQFDRTYEALRVYCKQDTWAMVEILNKLRKKIS